jgi:hypothetical protein
LAAACAAAHPWHRPRCRYELEEEEQPEERIGRYVREHCIVRENELYEDEHDHYGD